MKNLFCFLAIVAFLLVSCDKKETRQTVTEENTAENVSEIKAATLPETAAALNGTWIAKDYLDNVKKLRTIYGNPKFRTTMLGMSFLKDSLATGSSLLYGFGQHEVTSVWPVYWNTTTGRFEYDNKQATGDNPPGDFVLTLKDDKLLELQFTKTAKKELYWKADLETELNSLFAGSYTDKATGKTVTFTPDGKVQGLPGFVQYYVQYDPEAEEAVPFDAIFMSAKSTDEAGKPFHFKIKDNTLTLYAVDEHEVEKYIEYTYSIGKEAFVLEKK